MMDQNKLNAIFNKFAGREVPMTEETITHEFKRLGKQTYTEYRLANPKDPVLEEMRQEAQAHGLSLRVWWPGIMGTMDFRQNRVNAHIEQGADKKWRISNNFNLG